MGKWILGGVTGLLGLLGLYLSSRAADDMFYGGLTVFGVTLFAIYLMIKSSFDNVEEKLHHGGTEGEHSAA